MRALNLDIVNHNNAYNLICRISMQSSGQIGCTYTGAYITGIKAINTHGVIHGFSRYPGHVHLKYFFPHNNDTKQNKSRNQQISSN